MPGIKNIDEHSFKIKVSIAISTIIFIILTTGQLTNWKAQVESHNEDFSNKIINIEERIIIIRSDIDVLNEKSAARDIQLATINTKLANIESLLVEIKSDLRDSR